ncbi:uncharacterized protein BT62DRAFT_938171 [Guyanagaster necrorhizus]|uniref:Uncharacterized protein n=1 Tax=Guyanagaster necrorhizus TaxID=856835 RepID=A0A9P7VG57_9AGAR|nr:uncharacterized protein BT62DRAFT_938171 [Guyanagaster necrorhizus MCA 3950]KAG7440353.1 hypothetical protein BT62DRAFT_938171 [Guyanagaster necrorhizus MCA 3950]
MSSGAHLKEPVLYLHDLPAAITAEHLRSALQLATIVFDEESRCAVIKFPSILLARRAMKSGVICSVSGTSDVTLSFSASPPERLDETSQAAAEEQSGIDIIPPNGDNERIAKQGRDPDFKEKNECRLTDVDREQSSHADQFADKPPTPSVADFIAVRQLLKEEREQSDKRNVDHVRVLKEKVIELQRQNDAAELELQSQRLQISNLKQNPDKHLATALQAVCDEKHGLEQKLVELGLEVETMKLCQQQLEQERSQLLDSHDALQSTKEQVKVLCRDWEDREREIAQANRTVRAATARHAQEVVGLQRQLCVVNSRCKILELERDKLLWEDARVQREEKEQKEREMEQKRRAESMRKMEDEKRQKERLRTMMEEQARLERERAQAEYEEKQRLQRQKWHEATKAEKRRCQRRDKEKWNLESWTDSQAVERFLLLMDEFETTQYSESKPLTSAGIPWPVLVNPRKFKVTDLDDWQAVDGFFKVIRRHLERHLYKKVVMRARQMFHPDRWKSRNLLKSVMDDSVRSSLEAAGNKVSQAVNAL